MMIQRNVTIGLGLILLMTPGSGATAQERSELHTTRAEGEVRATAVADLSFVGLDHAPDVMATVFPLPDGGWGVSSRVFDGPIQRFDGEGAPAGVFGRAGEGPGEFGGPVFAVPVGEDIAVVDPANGRVSFFDREFSLIHDRPLPGRVRFVSLQKAAGSDFLVTGFLTDGTETRPVARLGQEPTDDVFGGEIESDNPRVSLKVAAEDSDGRVWTIANSGGAVNVLSKDDLRVLERWRLPGESFHQEAARRPGPGEPPVPQALGVGASGGIIWILMGVADRQWSPDVNPRRDGADAFWDTAILAIDADRRTVAARGRLDELCLAVAAGGLISCVDELGETIRILKLELSSPTAAQ